MDYPGTVQGEAARLYTGFTYRKPVVTCIDSILQFDPERLYQTSEYPRSVNPPSRPNMQTVDLADYVVRIGDSGNDGVSLVQIWMCPNEYTAARTPLLVYEFQVAHALTLRHGYCAELERWVFARS